MEKFTEKGLLEEFAKTLKNPVQQRIIEKYLEKFSIEDVEAFMRELISKEEKESEA
ncbi:MAG: hypothetical protein PWQ34_2044 [Caldanaerobacter sp.]|jgi:hypothetical protein|uniref:hypothetical protein n=1 Tax=Caldanaerobacter sp. TaxID=2930036 RepID=UPI0024AA8691|nr:hypothetical protein [Caldanaerobacter sp.]MDI3519897.1 hypothetical protein [Caldanaerobacter sp.]